MLLVVIDIGKSTMADMPYRCRGIKILMILADKIKTVKK